MVVLRRENALRGRVVRACVDEHDLHKRRRMFVKPPLTPTHVSRVLDLNTALMRFDDVPGSMACVLLFRGVARSKRHGELMAHAGAYFAPVDGIFEPAHRVYSRHRKVGFVAEFRIVGVKWAAPLRLSSGYISFWSGWVVADLQFTN